MDDREFQTLMTACAEVSSMFPEGVVYIGGIAVYLHAINEPQARELAEFTHDADFYISLAVMRDLSDLEEVTPNRRLSKHQMIKKGFEFDIYTERQSSLIVPYDEVMAHSRVYDGIRVASLEHLMVLKLEAYLDRKASAKGDKDAKDLLRIAAVATAGGKGFRAELAVPYLRDDHIELLQTVERGPHALALAHGNAVLAKKLRQCFAQVADSLRSAAGGAVRSGRSADKRAKP